MDRNIAADDGTYRANTDGGVNRRVEIKQEPESNTAPSNNDGSSNNDNKSATGNKNKKKKKDGSERTPHQGNGSKHEWREKKHVKREREREAIASGTAVPPPGAGPNWAKNRESTLAKYAKSRQRRHKKYEKRMREGEKRKLEADADESLPGYENVGGEYQPGGYEK